MENYNQMKNEFELSVREQEIEQLQILLANYQVYYQNLRNFHWNVRGKSFFELHVKFEELYNDANLKVDEIAERVLSLDGHPLGNFSDYLAISSIQESESHCSSTEMVQRVIDSHNILIKKVKDVIVSADENKDDGTLDLLPSYISYLEKLNWMFKAYLK